MVGEDQGRFNETGNERDRFLFRVSRLRNLPATGPYFHDASQATLADAIRAMAFNQVDEELNQAEVQLIEQFIEALRAQPTTR